MLRSEGSSIRAIFVKKMAYSAIIQFIVFALALILVKGYFYQSQVNTLTEKLIINDSFTTDEVGRYFLLDNRYALDLALFNLASERKLDSIKFVKKSDAGIDPSLLTCELNDQDIYKVCKTSDGKFSGVSAIKLNGNLLGYVVAKKQYNSIFSLSISYGILLILFIVFGIFLFNLMFLFLSVKKKIEYATRNLLSFISAHQENDKPDLSKIDIDEYLKIANKFIEEHAQITLLQKERAFYEARKNIAAQVAHDIRSPLAAINTAVLDVTSIPENKRIMIRNAAKRINDIANNLLLESKNNLPGDANYSDEKTLNSELLFVVLDNIVAEKKYEYSKINPDVQLIVSDDAYNCFVNINLESFKRVLSNLINNSIEAIPSNGFVAINVKCSSETVDIIIVDNGCGIPDDILPKITKQGFSFNKKNGAGFGLSYAKQQIESLNGNLIIKSEINLGTEILIRLPRSDCPQWFCNTFGVKPNALVVVLDDDPSVHDAWQEKLGCIEGIKLIHCYSVADFSSDDIKTINADFYLVDYELLADGKNGLDVIEDFKLNANAILVTSCFEDARVRRRCESMGVKIIPKSFVPYISVLTHCMSANKLLVLIDDDEILREAWKLAAADACINLLTYSTPNEFQYEMHKFHKDTHIYIDSDLGGNVKGEIYAKKLHDSGFVNVHLATGHPASKFTNLPWLKSIIGKVPPFLLG